MPPARPFRGITRITSGENKTRWRAQISFQSRTWALGDYNTEEEAAAAFDRATVCKAGFQAAQTNFPKENYAAEAERLQNMTMDEIMAMLRRERLAAKQARVAAAAAAALAACDRTSGPGPASGTTRELSHSSRSSSPAPDAKRLRLEGAGPAGITHCNGRVPAAGPPPPASKAPVLVQRPSGPQADAALAVAQAGQAAAQAAAHAAFDGLVAWLQDTHGHSLEPGWTVTVSFGEKRLPAGKAARLLASGHAVSVPDSEGDGYGDAPGGDEHGMNDAMQTVLLPRVTFVSPHGQPCDSHAAVAACLGLRRATNGVGGAGNGAHPPDGHDVALGGDVHGLPPAGSISEPLASDAVAASEAARMLTQLAARDERVDTALLHAPQAAAGGPGTAMLGPPVPGLAERLADAGAFDGLAAAQQQQQTAAAAAAAAARIKREGEEDVPVGGADGPPAASPSSSTSSRQPVGKLELLGTQMDALLSAADSAYRRLQGSGEGAAAGGGAGGADLKPPPGLRAAADALATERTRLAGWSGPADGGGSPHVALALPPALEQDDAGGRPGHPTLATKPSAGPQSSATRGGAATGPGRAPGYGGGSARGNVYPNRPELRPLSGLNQLVAAAAATLSSGGGAASSGGGDGGGPYGNQGGAGAMDWAPAPGIRRRTNWAEPTAPLKFIIGRRRMPRTRSVTAHTTLSAFVRYASGDQVSDPTAQLLLVLLSLPQSPTQQRQLPSAEQVAAFQAKSVAHARAQQAAKQAAAQKAAGQHQAGGTPALSALASRLQHTITSLDGGGGKPYSGPAVGGKPPNGGPSSALQHAAAIRGGPAVRPPTGPAQQHASAAPGAPPGQAQPTVLHGLPPGFQLPGGLQVPPGMQLAMLPDGRAVLLRTGPAPQGGAPPPSLQQQQQQQQQQQSRQAVHAPGAMARPPPGQAHAGGPGQLMVMHTPSGQQLVQVQVGPDGVQRLVQLQAPPPHQAFQPHGGHMMVQGGGLPPGLSLMQMPGGGAQLVQLLQHPTPGVGAMPQHRAVAQQPGPAPAAQAGKPAGGPAGQAPGAAPGAAVGVQQPQVGASTSAVARPAPQPLPQQQTAGGVPPGLALEQQQRLQALVAQGTIPPGSHCVMNPDGSITVMLPQQHAQHAHHQAQPQQPQHALAALPQASAPAPTPAAAPPGPAAQPQHRVMLVQTPEGLMQVLVPPDAPFPPGAVQHAPDGANPQAMLAPKAAQPPHVAATAPAAQPGPAAAAQGRTPRGSNGAAPASSAPTAAAAEQSPTEMDTGAAVPPAQAAPGAASVQAAAGQAPEAASMAAVGKAGSQELPVASAAAAAECQPPDSRAAPDAAEQRAGSPTPPPAAPTAPRPSMATAPVPQGGPGTATAPPLSVAGQGQGATKAAPGPACVQLPVKVVNGMLVVDTSAMPPGLQVVQGPGGGLQVVHTGGAMPHGYGGMMAPGGSAAPHQHHAAQQLMVMRALPPGQQQQLHQQQGGAGAQHKVLVRQPSTHLAGQLGATAGPSAQAVSGQLPPGWQVQGPPGAGAAGGAALVQQRAPAPTHSTSAAAVSRPAP